MADSPLLGALLELTKCMACDLGPDNIRVNCLCPGFIRTPASESHAKSMGLAFDDFVDSEKQVLLSTNPPGLPKNF